MRVCIPAAGIGSRLGDLTRHLCKALVDVGGKPALARIVDMFPEDTEFVIALGYKGELIREFIAHAFPERAFYFADVDPFEGAGSGLGYSLRQCEPYLRQPFIFISCDTLVLEKVPAPTFNWVGIGERENPASYRTVECNDRAVSAIMEKGAQGGCPYIGLAGILNYEEFWQGMREPCAIDQGEVCGLRQILSAGRPIEAIPYTWLDTGTPAGLHEAQGVFTNADAPTILPKPNEAIWFIDDKVIKFSADENFIRQRVERASELAGYIPAMIGSTAHMYVYRKASGEIISRIITPGLFLELLNFSCDYWQPATLDMKERELFWKRCLEFYKQKTLERVEKFYNAFQKTDGATTINGQEMPALHELLLALDWEDLSHGLPGRFHGDFHFENILWDECGRRFIFLDWRQNFGGDIRVGDIYYDFAKLLHGIIINHGLIARNLFTVEWQDDIIKYDFLRSQKLVICEEILLRWLEQKGFSQRKTRIITALVYLNIAALHHYPYSLLLYALGKDMLFNILSLKEK